MRSSQLYISNIWSKGVSSYIFAFVFLAAFFFSSKSFSQEIKKDSLKRPKIGLVLSGGGAKGFAHIGVFKVLEEAGIKIVGDDPRA